MRRSNRPFRTPTRRGEAYYPSSVSLPPEWGYGGAETRQDWRFAETPPRRVRTVYPAGKPFTFQPSARLTRLSSGFSAIDWLRRALHYGREALDRRVTIRQAWHCVQRKSRRETLFALKRAGFSGSAPKRHYVRRAESYYGC